jgi:hypothetical protein
MYKMVTILFKKYADVFFCVPRCVLSVGIRVRRRYSIIHLSVFASYHYSRYILEKLQIDASTFFTLYQTAIYGLTLILLLL